MNQLINDLLLHKNYKNMFQRIPWHRLKYDFQCNRWLLLIGVCMPSHRSAYDADEYSRTSKGGVVVRSTKLCHLEIKKREWTSESML